jgi:hypothetical protein
MTQIYIELNITPQVQLETGKMLSKTSLWLALLAKKRGKWFNFSGKARRIEPPSYLFVSEASQKVKI